MRISHHALEQYCLRKYGRQDYYLSKSVEEELEKRVLNAKPSKHHPKDFFHSYKSRKTNNTILLQDEEFIYAIKRDNLITVLSVPGTDVVTDFFMNNR